MSKDSIIKDIESAIYALESAQNSLNSLECFEVFETPEEKIYKNKMIEDKEGEYISNSFIIEFKKNISKNAFEIYRKSDVIDLKNFIEDWNSKEEKEVLLEEIKTKGFIDKKFIKYFLYKYGDISFYKICNTSTYKIKKTESKELIGYVIGKQ